MRNTGISKSTLRKTEPPGRAPRGDVPWKRRPQAARTCHRMMQAGAEHEEGCGAAGATRAEFPSNYKRL